MANLPTQDLNFQPAAKTQQYQNKDEEIKRKKYVNSLLILTSLLFIFLTIFTILLVSLNYYSVISLTNTNTLFKILPKSSTTLNDAVSEFNKQQEKRKNIEKYEIQFLGDNVYQTEGIITDLGENNIKIKLQSGKYINLNYNYDTSFYGQSKSGVKEFMFTSDFIVNNNIGKNVAIQFSKDKDKNILNSVEITN